MMIQHPTRPLVAATLAAGLAAALSGPAAVAAPAAGRDDVPLAQVADVRPGSTGSDPSRITAHAGGVYFVADDGAHGQRLWRSDGTAAGTSLVSATAAVSPSSELAMVGSTLFFSVGDQLWRSDGTEAGTQLVKDLGPTDVPLTRLTVAGNLVWFLADDGASGQELWRSDGTAAGTTRLTTRPPGADTLPLDDLTAVGSSLWFTGGDGAVDKTTLWRSDGTVAGTVALPLVHGSNDDHPGEITPAGGYVYFAWGAGSMGRDVFRVPVAGTVVEHVFGDESDHVVDLLADSDGLWISDSAYSAESPSGRVSAIWRSDGTAAGTRKVRDLPLEAARAYPLHTPEDLTLAGGELFFTHVDADHGPELWRSNGTTSGTKRLTDLAGSDLATRPTDLVGSDGRLWFVADGGRGRELWVSDGNVRGTHPVADARRGKAGSHPSGLTDAGGTLFMALDDGADGRELWSTRDDRRLAQPRVRTPRAERVGPGSWFVRARAGAGEWVESSARGRITMPGVRKPIVLKRARVTSYAGRTEVLRLEVPRRARASVLRAIRKATKSRAKVMAKVVVTLRDSSGNAKKVVRTIRLS